MNRTGLSDDTWVTLLLCSRLGQSKGAPSAGESLRDAAWHALRAQVEQDGRRIGGLLGRGALGLQASFGWNAGFAAQVEGLLASEARRELLTGEVARLAERGIWVLCWLDDAYPGRLRQRLGSRAPALLYGTGPLVPLVSNGVAVVGSRHLDGPGERFAERVGRRCARDGLTVFSGAAWGADRAAMLAATGAGGQAVGVVGGRLERLVRDPAFAPLVEAGRLTLVSKVLPSAGFSVGSAMDRNKLIYCLAESAVVVASSVKAGGTRAGALENLRRQWVPLYVRAGPEASGGNHELLERGGLPLLPEAVETAVWAPLAQAVPRLL